VVTMRLDAAGESLLGDAQYRAVPHIAVTADSL